MQFTCASHLSNFSLNVTWQSLPAVSHANTECVFPIMGHPSQLSSREKISLDVMQKVQKTRAKWIPDSSESYVLMLICVELPPLSLLTETHVDLQQNDKLSDQRVNRELWLHSHSSTQSTRDKILQGNHNSQLKSVPKNLLPIGTSYINYDAYNYSLGSTFRIMRLSYG